jgi:hypothetical protein
MEAMCCQIQCGCGGFVETLHEGVYYALTEEYEIVFQGICNNCGSGVRVIRKIQDLLMLCPVKKKAMN